MDNSMILILTVVALILVAFGIVWMVSNARRTKRLQETFGPEYERTLREHGRRRGAEAELQERARRVEKLQIRPLEPSERSRFATSWRDLQTRFVDDPQGAVSSANELVKEVMRARGYPVVDFEQRAADVSVDHPRFVENYRTAHEISVRQRGGQATTEDLRNAMLCYRALFDDLLEEHAVPVEVYTR